MRCKKQVPIKDAHLVRTSRGTLMAKGTCGKCGTKVNAMTSEDNAKKHFGKIPAKKGGDSHDDDELELGPVAAPVAVGGRRKSRKSKSKSRKSKSRKSKSRKSKKGGARKSRKSKSRKSRKSRSRKSRK
jgi:hypothetical protein